MTDEVKQGTSVKKKLNVKRGSLINKKLRTWAEKKKKKSRKLATQTAENSINVTSEGLATSSLCSSASFFSQLSFPLPKSFLRLSSDCVQSLKV